MFSFLSFLSLHKNASSASVWLVLDWPFNERNQMKKKKNWHWRQVNMNYCCQHHPLTMLLYILFDFFLILLFLLFFVPIRFIVPLWKCSLWTRAIDRTRKCNFKFRSRCTDWNTIDVLNYQFWLTFMEFGDQLKFIQQNKHFILIQSNEIESIYLYWSRSENGNIQGFISENYLIKFFGNSIGLFLQSFDRIFFVLWTLLKRIEKYDYLNSFRCVYTKIK